MELWAPLVGSTLPVLSSDHGSTHLRLLLLPASAVSADTIVVAAVHRGWWTGCLWSTQLTIASVAIAVTVVECGARPVDTASACCLCCLLVKRALLLDDCCLLVKPARQSNQFERCWLSVNARAGSVVSQRVLIAGAAWHGVACLLVDATCACCQCCLLVKRNHLLVDTTGACQCCLPVTQRSKQPVLVANAACWSSALSCESQSTHCWCLLVSTPLVLANAACQ